MQSAQSWACTRITYVFPDLYREYYLEEKTRLAELPDPPIYLKSKAQGRAKQRLRRLYPDVYKQLYEEGAAQGFPRANPKGRR